MATLGDLAAQEERAIFWPLLENYSNHFRLSERERAVLALAIGGVEDKVAADALGISRSTLGTYWQRIYAKTGARTQRNVASHVLMWLLTNTSTGSHARLLATSTEPVDEPESSPCSTITHTFCEETPRTDGRDKDAS